MYKYEKKEVSKLPYKWEQNKRAAKATRRPTAQQLYSDDIISLSLILGFVLLDIIVCLDMWVRWCA